MTQKDRDFNDSANVFGSSFFDVIFGSPNMSYADPQDKTMNNIIIKYIRKKDNTPIACLIAVKINDEVKIGWSMFHSKEEVIPFSKEKAKKLALSRARNSDLYTEHLEYNQKWKEYSSTIVPNFPSSLKSEMEMFMERARRYFDVEHIQNYSCCKMHNKKDCLYGDNGGILIPNKFFTGKGLFVKDKSSLIWGGINND